MRRRRIIQLKKWNPAKKCQKNVLYEILPGQTVIFEESQGTKKETVRLEYNLTDRQYGIYGYEYRGQITEKDGCKSPDILACAVDEDEKVIFSTICDVKSNISAFSDDLLRENAMLTAIKEVRDFIDQLHDGILHKNSFMLYYLDEGYREEERLGIITKNFEAEKFRAVAALLERLLADDADARVPGQVVYKMKNVLRPYGGEVDKIRAFADKTILIRGRSYDLHVFFLEESSPSELTATVEICAPCLSRV